MLHAHAALHLTRRVLPRAHPHLLQQAGGLRGRFCKAAMLHPPSAACLNADIPSRVSSDGCACGCAEGCPTLTNMLVIIVGGIPIAMPTVLSVTLALGAYKLAKEGAIVARMSAVEEMAGMDILCSDKTGARCWSVRNQHLQSLQANSKYFVQHDKVHLRHRRGMGRVR